MISMLAGLFSYGPVCPIYTPPTCMAGNFVNTTFFRTHFPLWPDYFKCETV